MGFWQFCGGPSQGCGGAPRPGARGSAAKAAGFKTFSREDGGAGEARRLCGGPAAGMRPPFVVGSNCAIFGTPCGGGHPSYRSVAPLHTVAALRFPAPSGPPIAPLPRNRLAFSAAGGASPLSSSPPQPLRWVAAGDPAFLKKRMRRARWKRKSLFAAQPALRASWRKCGGLPNRCRPDLPAFCRVRSTLAVVETAPPQLAGPRQSSWGGRSQGLSFYSRAFRFAMRCPGSHGRRAPSFRNHQGAAVKREAGCIRKYPQLSQLPYVVEWAKARKSPPGQAPVTGAASVPDEVRNAAAKPFSLDTIKRRFLFFLGKRERGF